MDAQTSRRTHATKATKAGSSPTNDSHPKSSQSASPSRSGEMKRTLTADNVMATVTNLMNSSPVLIEAALKRKISASLREKIFLAVSSVNDCRYCKWAHSHWAMAQGVALEEVNEILGHQSEALEAKDADEAAAILFAQHYAEHLDQIDPESIENLRKHYSDDQVAEIIAYVRFITFTNLTGNTVDVFFDRIRTNLVEGVVSAAAGPLALMLNELARFDRKVGMDPMRSHKQVIPKDGSTELEGAGNQSASSKP
jgi:AhpD family alkylhydroperoxidase